MNPAHIHKLLLNLHNLYTVMSFVFCSLCFWLGSTVASAQILHCQSTSKVPLISPSTTMLAHAKNPYLVTSGAGFEEFLYLQSDVQTQTSPHPILENITLSGAYFAYSDAVLPMATSAHLPWRSFKNFDRYEPLHYGPWEFYPLLPAQFYKKKRLFTSYLQMAHFNGSHLTLTLKCSIKK